MDVAEQVALIDRILAHRDARTTDTAESVATQAVEAYTSPVRFAREMERLFVEGPVAVAHVGRVPSPGDFVTLELAGRPLLVVRDADGEVLVHLNVCRHRGSRLVEAASGSECRRFECPYHAWTYAADGRLVGLPHRGGFPGVSSETHGLVRVPSVVRGGFIWIGRNLEDEAFAPLAQLLESEGIPEHTVYDVREETHEHNWKLSLDVFLEAYHVRTTHAESISPVFFDNVGLVSFYGPHQRGVFPKRTIESLRGTDPATWRLRDHANLLLHLFPNTLVLLQPDHAAVVHVLPTAVDRCTFHSYTLVPDPPLTEKARAYWDTNNEILRAATTEDLQRAASIQSTLHSGANQTLTFGRYEHGLAHFHHSLSIRGT